MTSAAPPAANGTTTRTGRSGHSAAAAARETMQIRIAATPIRQRSSKAPQAWQQRNNRPSVPNHALPGTERIIGPASRVRMILPKGGADSFRDHAVRVALTTQGQAWSRQGAHAR